MYDLSLNCFRELADRIDDLALEISTKRERLAGTPRIGQEEPMVPWIQIPVVATQRPMILVEVGLDGDDKNSTELCGAQSNPEKNTGQVEKTYIIYICTMKGFGYRYYIVAINIYIPQPGAGYHNSYMLSFPPPPKKNTKNMCVLPFFLGSVFFCSPFFFSPSPASKEGPTPPDYPTMAPVVAASECSTGIGSKVAPWILENSSPGWLWCGIFS